VEESLSGPDGETVESLNQTEQARSLNQTGQTGQAANRSTEGASLPGTEEQLQEPASQADPLPPQTQTQQTAQSEKQVLEISSVEACWLSADVDNRSKDIYLRPGESITFRFDETLKIKLGNAGGVKLRFNGEEVPLDARSGDVKTLTFP
jgi:cytoskeleton protein RodZ